MKLLATSCITGNAIKNKNILVELPYYKNLPIQMFRFIRQNHKRLTKVLGRHPTLSLVAYNISTSRCVVSIDHRCYLGLIEYRNTACGKVFYQDRM